MDDINGKINLKHSSLLLVDDDSNNIHEIEHILKRYKYDLQCAESGEKAIQSMKNKRPDLVLLNDSIPDSNGFEMCKRLKEEHQFKDIPVIVLIKDAIEKDGIEQGFKYGADDYLTKPYITEELISRITTHLKLKKYKDHLKSLSTVDPLTKLLTVKRIREKIADEEIRARRSNLSYSLILCRLNVDKQIVDSYDNEVPEKIRKLTAEILTTNTREQDIISRWGENEFLLLLPNTDRYGGKTLAEKLRRLIEEKTYRAGDQDITVTATMGVITSKGEKSYEKCLKEAQKALSRGEQNGGNRSIHFNDQVIK